MSTFREAYADLTRRCRLCLQKLSLKEDMLYHGYCLTCWRLHAGDLPKRKPWYK